jgi:hypothetical protein
MPVATDDLVPWLLEGDPAIRWRVVHRDLLDRDGWLSQRDRPATLGQCVTW